MAGGPRNNEYLRFVISRTVCFQTLRGEQERLSQSRVAIRSQLQKNVPEFVHYLAGMLSLFSSTVEPERLFREAGRLDEGRESL